MVILFNSSLKFNHQGTHTHALVHIAVREELIEENFSIELEKMICKRKYRSIDDSAKMTEFDPAKPLQTGSSFPAKICNEIYHRIF